MREPSKTKIYLRTISGDVFKSGGRRARNLTAKYISGKTIVVAKTTSEHTRVGDVNYHISVPECRTRAGTEMCCLGRCRSANLLDKELK